MSLPFSHAFSTGSTNLDLNTYGHGWTRELGDKYVVTTPGRAFANDTSDCSAIITGETFTGDHEISGTPKGLSLTRFAGLIVRAQGGGTGIYVGWYSDGGVSVLFTAIAGIHTPLLLTSGSMPLGLGNEKMTLRASGSEIIGLVNDMEAFRAATILTGGRPGMIGRNGNSGAAYFEQIDADDDAPTLDRITDLAVTRNGGGTGNDLAWTMDPSATTHEIARSPTGVGGPGATGTDGDWTIIEADAGAVAVYADAPADRAFYAVRWTDGVDSSPWSNDADDTLGTNQTSIGHFISRPGLRRYRDGDRVNVLVEAAHEWAAGGIDYVLFTITDALSHQTQVVVSREQLWRGNERDGVTDPLSGCFPGQTAPVRAFGCVLIMSDFPVGTLDVAADIMPKNGTGISLAAQRHYNFRDGSGQPTAVYLNAVSGSDANTGLSAAQARQTMQAAMAAGATGVGTNEVGLVRVNVIGPCLWNRVATDNSLFCQDAHWLEVVPVAASGAEIAKDGDWANKPAFTGASGTMRVCFQDLPIRGSLRTTGDGAFIEVCFDHCEVLPHAPWDAGDDPWVGAYDEGGSAGSGVFWTSSNEPAATWWLGVYAHHSRVLIVDGNLVARGCRFSTGYGVTILLADNVAIVACQVDEWRHSSDEVRGYFADVTSTHLQAVNRGDGKLRVRVVTGQTAGDFATEAANLVGATLFGVNVAGFVNAGGNDDTYKVLAAGSDDGSGRQYIDLDAAAFTEAAGASVTLRPGRVSDGQAWATTIHSDVVKLNSPRNATNCSLVDIYGRNNSTPRGFGLDSSMTRVRIDGWFPGLAHETTRNDDIGAASETYTHVMIRNSSFNGAATFIVANDASGCEIRNCVFDGTNANGLSPYKSQWVIDSCHFVDPNDVAGSNSSHGPAFASPDPGPDGIAVLNPISDGLGVQLGTPEVWYRGDRGVLQPSLKGDWSWGGASSQVEDDGVPQTPPPISTAAQPTQLSCGTRSTPRRQRR